MHIRKQRIHEVSLARNDKRSKSQAYTRIYIYIIHGCLCKYIYIYYIYTAIDNRLLLGVEKDVANGEGWRGAKRIRLNTDIAA